MKSKFTLLPALLLAPLATLHAAAAVGKAAKDATRGWQNAPAEMQAIWQRHKDALKILDISTETNCHVIVARGTPKPGAYHEMQARAVIRDVGRVMDIPYAEVDRIAKLIPGTLNITLDQALEQEPRLREAINKDPRVESLFTVAKSLEGLTRHASTHAAGIVIANKSLMEYLPPYRGQNGEVMTQFTMKDVEKIGLVKFDFLGLKTLTVLDQTVKLVEKERGVKVNLAQLPLDDADTYALLSSGATLGIFQLEGTGMRDLLIKLKPEQFTDIIALVALYRPGPLGSGMVDEFIKRKQGHESVRYDIKELEDILKDNYGVIVYQEHRSGLFGARFRY